MKKTITLALSCLFMGATAFAQQTPTPVKRSCAVMEMLEQDLTKNPDARHRMEQMEAFTQRKVKELAKNHRKIEGNIIKIPVVVHVLYTNSTNNISNAQIQSQLDVLNEDFRRTNSDKTNKWSQAADSEIEFYLAKVDPNGNPTTGIVRKQTSTSTWITDTNGMKKNSAGGISPWNTAEYLNMWVVDNLRTSDGRSILGYAQFPWMTDKSLDGVVMADQYFGRTGTAKAPFDGGRTTTHEVGHYLGLRHIWGDGPCGTDDFVSDTPESDAANYGCKTGHVSCGSEDMVQNFMDYSDDSCMNLFTTGQKNRMRTYLAEGGARRALALSDKSGSGGGTPTPSACSSTVSSFPYSESFESGIGAWTQATDDNFDWTRDANGTPSSSTGPSSAAAGSYYMFTESSNPNYPTKTAIFNSPCFDLSSVSNAKFKFKYHMYGSSMGTLKLEVQEDGSSTWTSVWSKSGDQGNSWKDAEVNLASKKLKVRFHLTTASSYRSDAAIDAISVVSGASSADTQAPTAPTNLSAASVTKTSFTLNWSAASDNVGVTGYDVYQGSSKLGSVTGTSANITSLTAGTTYSFSVRAKDAAGNVSASSAALSVTTQSNAVTYCGSKSNRSTYEWIDNVELGGMKNPSGDDGGYKDYTAKVASLARGSSNDMIISAGFKSTAYTEHWAVWIDFNQNGTFEASEKVVTGSSSSANNLRATVQVPAGASLGQTRMRVSMKYNAAQTACETFDDGEVEDYTVNITAASSKDNGAVALSNAQPLGNETASEVMVYPNPATSFVQVRVAAEKGASMSYRVLNTIGRVVMAGELTQSAVDVSQLNSGVYILELNDGQKLLTNKLIKK